MTSTEGIECYHLTSCVPGVSLLEVFPLLLMPVHPTRDMVAHSSSFYIATVLHREILSATGASTGARAGPVARRGSSTKGRSSRSS